MSHCDRSGLNIFNNSGLPITIQGIQETSGSVQDLHSGQVIEHGKHATGRAYSGRGTQGDAEGKISIQIGGQGDVAGLSYSFRTEWTTGAGKCWSSGDSAKFNSGDKRYEAVCSRHDGNSEGEAGIEWRVVTI